MRLEDLLVGRISETGEEARDETIGELEEARGHALRLAATNDDFDIYERIEPRHDAVVGRLKAFVKAAGLVANGQYHVVGKKSAGTKVALSLTALDGDEVVQAEPLRVTYLVRSKNPLVFHVGYTYSTLKNVEFNQVRALAGQDLFSLVNNEERTDDFAANLSYTLWSAGASGQFKFMGTLGTGMKDPGSQLYVGASALIFNYVIVTGGAVSSLVTEGGSKLVENLGAALGTRELFATISRRRDWAPFVGVSFRVY